MKDLNLRRVLEVCFVIAVLSTIGGIGSFYYANKRHVVLGLANQMKDPVADLKTMEEKELVEHVKYELYKVKAQLKNDAYGKAGMIFLLRQIAPKSLDADAKAKDFCLSYKKCPISKAKVYEVCLRRLDEAFNWPAMLLMQASLMRSDLKPVFKVRVLVRSMLTTRLSMFSSRTIASVDGKVQFGPDVKYVMTSAQQLARLGLKPIQFLKVTIAAVSRIHDVPAKKMIMIELNKDYPDHSKAIHAAAEKMGVPF